MPAVPIKPISTNIIHQHGDSDIHGITRKNIYFFNLINMRLKVTVRKWQNYNQN